MLISAAEVAEDRAMANAEMIDTCRITRAIAPSPDDFNESTLQYDPPPPEVIYEGPCRVQVRADINSNAVEAVVAEHEWTYRTGTLQLPITAPADAVGSTANVRPDDTAEILTCPLDVEMAGRQLNLQADTKGKTMASCRRFRTRELLS